jgi:hypothetical protein
VRNTRSLRAVRAPVCARFGPARTAAVALAWAFLAAGCAQHARVICEPLEFASRADFKRAIAALDKTSLAGSSRDAFLYHADRGVLLRLAGDYAASTAEFEAAISAADALEPWSVTETLTDYAVNEAVKAYAGEDYERAYLHYYLALNYLAEGDREGALVECRRLDEVFRKLDARYEEGTRRYQDDGFIRYLSGLIYESVGKLDDALIDYDLGVRAYQGETGAGAQMGVPSELLRSFACTARALGQEERVTALVGSLDIACEVPPSEIVVIIDSGWAPYKREESVEVPIYRPFVPEELRGSTNLAALVKIAYPVYESVPEVVGGLAAAASDSAGGSVVAERPAERVQDLDALARWTLERRIGAVKFRSTLRATVKQIALMRAKHDEKNESKPFVRPGWRSVLGWLAEDLATAAVAETEQADTRSWLMLPRSVWIARIPVEPGEYEVSVRPEAGGTIDLGGVRVEPGGMTFVSGRVFGGPHPIRCDSGPFGGDRH